jgi:hypothetical protein
MIKILGVSRFPWRIFWACMALAIVSALVPADASHRHYHRGCNATATWDCRSAYVRHEFLVETGYPHGRRGWIVDHVNPLDCGGADAVTNMQWQTRADAAAKDAWETVGCRDGKRVGPPAPGNPE